jgi:type I restriction-modification system DNA methylase subunit
MATYLQGPLMDDDFRRNLEGEEQLDYIFEEQETKHLKELAKKEKEKLEERKQKEAAEEREQAERKLKEAAEEREQAERKLKEEANKEKEDLAIKLARQLKKTGATLSESALETGLPIEDVEEVTSDE